MDENNLSSPKRYLTKKYNDDVTSSIVEGASLHP